MSSSPVDRMSGASTPTLLAMSSLATNRLHEELSGLKRWRQMYDSAMKEKNEELQKLQLINQRQTQTLNESIAQVEQQTMSINSMKQNELVLEKKVTKLEELHHILKKNVAKLEKTVSQCEFVRVDLERMYEHQERSVKALADRVDVTIDSKLHTLQSQLHLAEQLHEQARLELNKQIQERTQDNAQATAHIADLMRQIATVEQEMNQLQSINTNAQQKINELTDETNNAKRFIEANSIEHEAELAAKIHELNELKNRLETLALKIDAIKEELFNSQESNKTLQNRIDEMQQTTVEHTVHHEAEVQARQSEIQSREKENDQLRMQNNQLIEQMANRDHELEELQKTNEVLQNGINEANLQLTSQVDATRKEFEQQLDDHTRQSIESDKQVEQHKLELHEKDTMYEGLKRKHDELVEKMDLNDEEMIQLTKENEELRAQNQLLYQETDERNEQIKQKDVIVEATNIEINEKEKEIDELKTKVASLEERLSKNQNLLTSLRSSMGEKDAKIKRLEQGTSPSQPSRSPTVRRAGIHHPLAATQQKTASSIRAPLPPPIAMSQQTKVNPREKRMLPPPASTDLTSTPKKILRLSQTKAAIDQAHALEESVSPVSDDERDEVASNTSVASLFEYLKKI